MEVVYEPDGLGGLLQLLRDSFVRIRDFGFLANRRRATFSPLGFSLLGSAPQTEQDTSGTKDFTVFRCARVLI